MWKVVFLHDSENRAVNPRKLSYSNRIMVGNGTFKGFAPRPAPNTHSVKSSFNYVIILVTSTTLSPPSFILTGQNSLPPFIQCGQELVIKTFRIQSAQYIAVLSPFEFWNPRARISPKYFNKGHLSCILFAV